MKRRDLIKEIERLGYKFVKHGGNHDTYSDGSRNETIPRHNEIKENLAKSIIKRCGG